MIRFGEDVRRSLDSAVRRWPARDVNGCWDPRHELSRWVYTFTNQFNGCRNPAPL
jgi:hypothetical protein